MENKQLLPAETLSFLQLVERYAILVPVIQRDYAQGRKTEEVNKIREDFVHDLICFIKDNTRPHHVDFVYGTVEKRTGHFDAFIPLDGQQRLTTLFLLHLYLAGMSENYEYFSKIITDRFEYATRKSSTEFCKGLISHDVCGDLLRKRQDIPNTKISRVIENQGWFFSAWKQDPTIMGMLVMLDEIDRQITLGTESSHELFNNLFQGGCQPIVFQWQPLDGYTLTDDLYIKMNARGLKLTDFEVFKALYEMSLDCIQDKTKDIFEMKIDGDWCDFLWQRKGELNSTDIVMERILRLMIAFGYAGMSDKKDEQKLLDKLFARQKQSLQFSYSRYRELGVFHDTHAKSEEISKQQIDLERHIAQCVVEAFNIICDDKKSPLAKPSCCLPWYDEQTHVNNILHKKFEDITYDELVFFYAYVSFLARYQGDVATEQVQWMRYIHNLLNASNTNDSMQLARIIKSVDNILDDMEGKKVLCWIAENPKVDAFPYSQAFEESIKAKLILWSEEEKHLEPRWKQLIKKNETDGYMKGQIGFLLAAADVYNFNFDTFDLDSSDKALNLFAICSDKARSIFSHFDDLSSEHLLERALLTKGLYLKRASAWRLNFCNNPYHRDFSWRKMLEISPEEGPSRNVSVTKMIDLLKESWADNTDPVNSLRAIVDNYMADSSKAIKWYSPLIGNLGIELINDCHQGFIQNYQDNNQYIILLHESQMNHYHAELQSRLLYFELKKDYDFVHYCSVRSADENSGLYFRIKLDGLVVTIYIYQKEGWHLEVWDEPMYTNVIYTTEWKNIALRLSQILGIELGAESIAVSREYIVSLIKSANREYIV